MSLSVGDVLKERYRIVAPLGEGGMGAVYRAWDLNLKMPVAVKENGGASAEGQRQFEREATLLARLAHANLPRVTDHFALPGGEQYLVMDYIEGEDLASMLERQGTLAPEQAVGWVSQVCDALAYLHGQQPAIIHRDVKPANIRIARDGRAVLVDFGISKLLEPGGRTTVGAMAVTAHYSPPEQYGAGMTDARSDIYALGATLYHLLTGQPPPESTMRLAGEGVTPPRRFNAAIPPQVEQAVLAALALPREERFQTAAAMREGLAGGRVASTVVAPTAAPALATVAIPGAVVASRSAPEEGAGGRRPGWVWPAVGLALLLLVTLGGFMLVRSGLLGGEEESATLMATSEAAATDAAATDTAAGEATVAALAIAQATPSATATLAATATQVPPTATPLPTLTPLPTATPRCPVVEGPFGGAWATHEERLGCAIGEPLSHSGAEEAFEFGMMFWRSDAIDYGQALVAFNDGTWRIFTHAPFVEGSPDFKCVDANTPPECPPTPKRGFGMMWCDIGAIRSGLGNAVECERPYTGLQQPFQRGFLLRTDSGTYVFLDDGTWEKE